jgi:hypothetical protein
MTRVGPSSELTDRNLISRNTGCVSSDWGDTGARWLRPTGSLGGGFGYCGSFSPFQSRGEIVVYAAIAS